MALQTEYKFLDENIKENYVFDEDNEDKKQLVYRIDKKKLIINFILLIFV